MKSKDVWVSGAGMVVLMMLALAMSGCSLFAPPQPRIEIYNTRVVTNQDHKIVESKDAEGNPTLISAPKKTRVADGDRIELGAYWPDDFSTEMVFSEAYREDLKDREMLKDRSWRMNAQGGSTAAMLYGINQTDRASEFAISTANAAAAVASAGQTEVARILANAALEAAGKSGDEKTVDTVAAILSGLKGLNEDDGTTEAGAAGDAAETDNASETDAADDTGEAGETNDAGETGDATEGGVATE